MPDLILDRRIAQTRKRGVVELQIAATELGQIGDLLLVDADEIVEIDLDIGVDGFFGGARSEKEMHHRR